MMVLSQACQPLCYLSDWAALTAATLSAAWSHPKPTLLLSKKGRVPHSVRSFVESTSALSPQGGPCICTCGVPAMFFSHWGLLCYLKTHLWNIVEEVT